MKAPGVSLELNLQRAAAGWKWLRVLQHVATVGGIVCLVVAFMGVAMARGWVYSSLLATAFFGMLGIASALACFIVAVRALTRKPDRKWLAGSLEGADPRLQDRLNTLVHLEKNRRADAARWFFGRIARQTHAVISEKPPPFPFSPLRPLLHLAGFVLLLGATIFIYHRYSPWARMREAEMAHRPAVVAKPAELALPTNNVAEEQKLWGGVRITDPARDLKVTKVDVVPLQIEAAANQPLKKVAWFSTINGTEEKPHELAAPTEPRYAVYQPVVYLDELRLADWDVLTYYANARTEHGESYASEVYFLEVRPFREDILKLPGGQGGKAYQTLSEMTSLIERQQHVIRQTHQYLQTPEDEARLREQDRKKLSGAEDDLGESVRHLYARMSTEMENQPIGEALDSLAKAEKSLGSASKSLVADSMKDAQNHERAALADLVAARKMYQKAISDHPDAFADKTPDEERDPVAQSAKQLNDIAEFRNEAKAAQDFVKKTLEQQHQLEEKTAAAARADEPKLAQEETKLQKSLKDFEQQHPQIFNQASNEVAAADQALKKATESLDKKSRDARASAANAESSLEKLQSAVASGTAGRQLADAYKLKQLLDEEIKALNQMQSATNNLPQTNRQQMAADSRETLNQLKQIAENKPTSDSFGPQLRDSLSGTNKSATDSQLDRLAQAASAEQQKQAAGEAAKELKNVSEAFGASQPSALQSAHKHDALKPGQQESLERGLAQLESMKKQMEGGHALPAGQSAKERQEALANLSEGLSELYGQDARAKQLLVELQDGLQERGKPLDLAMLKKLMDELRNFSIEVADKRDKNDNPELTNVDPSRLPPAYRGRIQKYYEKLSEQKP